MDFGEFSRTASCKALIGCFGFGRYYYCKDPDHGAEAFGSAMLKLEEHDSLHDLCWCILACLALCSGPWKMNMPETLIPQDGSEGAGLQKGVGL